MLARNTCVFYKNSIAVYIYGNIFPIENLHMFPCVLFIHQTSCSHSYNNIIIIYVDVPEYYIKNPNAIFMLHANFCSQLRLDYKMSVVAA